MRVLVLMAAAALSAAPVLAADAPPAPVRRILQSVPASGAAGQQINLADVVFPPGAKLGWHTHPGEEIGVVVTGRLKLEIEGKPALLVGPGESFAIPRGTAHQASAPEGETHVVSTYVVDKDKPLATLRP